MQAETEHGMVAKYWTAGRPQTFVGLRCNRTCHGYNVACLRVSRGGAITRPQQHVQQVAVTADARLVAAVRLRAAQVTQRHRQQPQGGQVVAGLASADEKRRVMPMRPWGHDTRKHRGQSQDAAGYRETRQSGREDKSSIEGGADIRCVKQLSALANARMRPT